MIYKTIGTCSQEIFIELDGDIIRDVRFVKGCPGNLQAVAVLAKGRKAEDVAAALSGIVCGQRLTSCPDQLAAALRQLMKEN